MKGDLHCHSYYSDGYNSPAEVMKMACEAGCEVISLTDHDTLGGLSEAESAAHALGLKFIRGIEISSFDNVETHILGYGIDAENARFNGFLDSQKHRRKERARLMIDKLEGYGITFPEDAFDFCVGREISRAHIADAIVRYGYEPDFETAFMKWCKRGTPSYVFIGGAFPRDAIEEIHRAGGLAVLAHPMRIPYRGDDLTAYVKKIASFGIDGIEAVYRDTSESEAQSYIDLASRLGVFYTAGNDFHGLGRNPVTARELHCDKLLALAK